jgi:hypothetical protein
MKRVGKREKESPRFSQSSVVTGLEPQGKLGSSFFWLRMQFLEILEVRF